MKNLKFIAFFVLILAIGRTNSWSLVRLGETFYGIRDVKSAEDLNDYSSVLRTYDTFNYWTYGMYNSGYQYWSAVKKISIINSTMEKISSNLFSKFTLTELVAVKVGLKEINREDFSSAGTLEILNLSDNQIAKMDNMLFMNCKKLITLDLSKNEINFVHENAFEEISKDIQKIDLSFNKIKIIKEETLLLVLKTASALNVTIDLNDNEIEEVTTSKQNTAGNLTLVRLNLMNNKLKALELSQLNSQWLNVESNELSTLSAKFAELCVNNNKLGELHIRNTTVHVSAFNNPLTKLTVEADALETLHLSGNKLGDTILLKIKHAKKLNKLSLSDTLLRSLAVDSFADMENLEELSLANNAISSVSFGQFSHQKKLKQFNISYNSLDTIDLHVLATLSALETLDISSNSISAINDLEIIQNLLPNLNSISLEGNKWNCEYLSKAKINLTSQDIQIVPPRNPIKDRVNFQGIECSESEAAKDPSPSSRFTKMEKALLGIVSILVLILVLGIYKKKMFCVRKVDKPSYEAPRRGSDDATVAFDNSNPFNL